MPYAEEEIVESARNAEGGTSVGYGKPDVSGLRILMSRMGNETPGEALDALECQADDKQQIL
jgi:hypothetical protein